MTTVLITLRPVHGRTRYEARVGDAVYSALFSTVVMMALYNAGYVHWQLEGI